jgi:hypothetical protein
VRQILFFMQLAENGFASKGRAQALSSHPTFADHGVISKLRGRSIACYEAAERAS